MLVLLIMFVITIPVATHSVEIDLPRECSDCPPTDPIRNKLSIDASDRLSWNGTGVDERQLAATRAMAVEPELQFEPAARASYRVSARTLRLIQMSGVSRFGFVGNEKYRTLAQR